MGCFPEKQLPLHGLCKNRCSVGRRIAPRVMKDVEMKMSFMVSKRLAFFFFFKITYHGKQSLFPASDYRFIMTMCNRRLLPFQWEE